MDNNLQKTKTTPVDFFLILGMIVTLYVSTFSILKLLFSVINYRFPDTLAYYADPYSSDIRFAVASLIIIFPLYLFITWYLDRSYELSPEKRELGVRKWLVYFTLFVAGIGLVIDLIYLINTFLGGEITMRFVLKVLSVFVVAGGIFGYYILDIRKGVGTKTFMIISALFVAVSIVGGFLIMGSPGTQRDYQQDSLRVQNLQDLQWRVANYWQQKKSLPLALSALEDPIQGTVVPADPETGESYEYRIKNAKTLTFELCATFAKPSRDLAGRGDYGTSGEMSKPYPVGGGFNDTPYFKHEAGEQCFERTIDPDIFPPYIKSI